MLSANAIDLEKAFKEKGIDVDQLTLDPTLPELKLEKGAFAKWIGMMDDVDAACQKTVDTFKNHPLIPDDIVISGWIWEVETRRLRAPTTDSSARARTGTSPQINSALKVSNRLAGVRFSAAQSLARPVIH
jgi:carbonic anhydrase